MGYFDNEMNVEEYIKKTEGVDGRQLVEVLKRHLRKGSRVLELGMGPGKDFEILSEFFQVTGSDNSKVFLERYRKRNANADLVLLDAVTMNINRRFDCIYSNKVLHHLTKEELKESFDGQLRVLNSKGILFHTFWYGDKEEEFPGLRVVYYTEETFGEIIGGEYKIVTAERYSEIERDDSIFFVLTRQFMEFTS
jgi:cyclopropane fatty-acyl-phospholipid synthase-like methyltransferase